MGEKFHGSKHHVVPVSRRGKENHDNEINLDYKIHNSWHVLFGNLLIEEVISIICHVWQDDRGVIREKYLLGEVNTIRRRKKVLKKDKRLFAWKTIFGETRSSKEAVEIIKKTFLKRT